MRKGGCLGTHTSQFDYQRKAGAPPSEKEKNERWEPDELNLPPDELKRGGGAGETCAFARRGGQRRPLHKAAGPRKGQAKAGGC